MATYNDATDRTITSGGSISAFSHSLGGTPDHVDFFLICQTGEYGYSAGDCVRPWLTSSGSADSTGGACIWANNGNTTQLGGIFADNASNRCFPVVRENTDGFGNHGIVNLSNSNWKLRLHARLNEETGTSKSIRTTSISTGTATTLAHNLSGTPKMIGFALQCVTAEGGYSAGDIVWPIEVGTETSNVGISVRPDSTNLNIIWGNPGGGGLFTLLNKTTGAKFRITNANWNVRFYCALGTVATGITTGPISSGGASGNITTASTQFLMPCIVCSSSDLGYAAADTVFNFQTAHAATNFGCVVRRNNSGRYVTEAAGQNVIPFFRKDTNTFGSATDSKWNLEARRFN